MEAIETNPKFEKWKAVLDEVFGVVDQINEVLKLEPLFITKTVDELAWGYEDPVFKLVHNLDPSLLPSANFSFRVRNLSISSLLTPF